MIRDRTPDFSRDGTQAEYKFEQKVGNKSSIVFVKEEEFWCIRN